MAAEADIVLAKSFGVSPETISSLRKRSLVKPDHYTSDGRALTYTEEGLKEVARQLDTEAPEKKEGGAPDAGTQEPENELPAPQVELLVIARYPNPTAVKVRTPDGAEVPVQVRSSDRIRAGMRLPCVFVGERWETTHPTLRPRR